MIFLTLNTMLENFDVFLQLASRNGDGDILLIVNEEDYEDEQNILPTSTSPINQPRLLHSKMQAGFSLVEMLIAITLMSITLLAIGALSSLTANGVALAMRKKSAENLAVQVASKLKAEQKTSLPAGGAFAVDNDGLPLRNNDSSVTLYCNPSYCDRVISIPAATTGSSSDTGGAAQTEKIIGWNDPVPKGGTQKFIRAWTLVDEDVDRNWRRITVAVFPPESTLPVTYTVTGGVIK